MNNKKYFKEAFGIMPSSRSSVIDFNIPVFQDTLSLNDITYEIKLLYPEDKILIKNPIPKLFSCISVYIGNKLIEEKTNPETVADIFCVIENFKNLDENTTEDCFVGKLGSLGLPIFNSDINNEIQYTKLSICLKKKSVCRIFKDSKDDNVNISFMTLRLPFNIKEVEIPRKIYQNIFDNNQVEFSGKFFVKNFTHIKPYMFLIVQITDKNIPFKFIKVYYKDQIFKYDKKSPKIIDYNNSWYLFFMYDDSSIYTDCILKILFESKVDIKLNFIFFTEEIFIY